jgi:dUTP pyrophosphatase
MKVKIKKLYTDVKLPIKGSLHAACYDVYAHSINVGPSGKVVIGLGFATEIPEGWKGIIVPRSNLVKHQWVMNNSIGVIDSDYRGEWMIILTHISNNSAYPVTLLGSTFPYKVGERVAQIYFDKVEEVELSEVAEIASSDRGEGSFGSTGLK